jgi:prophage maintenance system killer protein
VEIQYVTFEEVVQLHDLLCFLYGGATEMLNKGAVESAVAQPQQAVFGTECYPSLYLKAAAYCYFLCLGHGFRDGNKRAGVASAFHLLRKMRNCGTGSNSRRPPSDTAQQWLSLTTGNPRKRRFLA